MHRGDRDGRDADLGRWAAFRRPPLRAGASIYLNDGRSQPVRIEPSYKAFGRLRVLGWLGVADFDPFGEKFQEDANPDRQEPTLS
jgi:hypothetical protein